MFKRTLLLSACITIFSVSSYASDSTKNTEETNNTKETSPISGTFDITTNYVFRGISNSNNNPAVQGGLTYTFESGVYANLWGSSLDFFAPDGARATVEFDEIIGIANSIGNDFEYNINFDYYTYPRASDANYYEFIGAFTYKIFTLTLGYSPDVYGSHENGTYVNGALNLDIDPKYVFNFTDVIVTGSVGHYFLPTKAGLSYTDYLIGIQKTFHAYNFSLQWTDTNGEAELPPLDRGHLVFTVLVSF